MPTYDVTIVGAGPAGSTAAYCLARAGVKVGLIDKQTFPRDKVCGDAVSAAGLAWLEQMGLGAWLEQNSFNAPGELLFSAPNGQAVRIVPDDPDRCYGRIIPRLQLDEAMLGQALGAGAILLEGVKLAGLTRLPAGRVRLSGSYGEGRASLALDSRLVITADGAHASFTRSLGLVKEAPDLVAVRAYFENVGGSESLLEIHYDQTLTPGYVWLFPLRNGRANVGLGTYVQRARQGQVDLRQVLDRFLRDNPYAQERLGQAHMAGPLKGFLLRSHPRGVVPCADNVLVAGEAAGLVNPLNGEGIATAIASGQLAARQVLAALDSGRFGAEDLKVYAKELRRQIGRNHLIAAMLRRLLALPGVMNRIAQRARHDHDFAQTLFGVMVEIKPMSAALQPQFLLKLIAG